MRNNLLVQWGNAIGLMSALFVLPATLQAQPYPMNNHLNGDNIVGTTNVHGYDTSDVFSLVATSKGVYIEETDLLVLLPGALSSYLKVYTPPPGSSIQQISPKKGQYGGPRILFVLLDDGSVVEIDFSYYAYQGNVISIKERGTIGSPGLSWEKVVGDDIYALGASVYVSRDTGKTWQIDSAGLGNGVHFRDIALDTSLKVYAATTAGLFEQAPDSSTWQRVTSLISPSSLVTVFIDRRNRIFVVGNGAGVYLSTDDGSSWNPDTVGIGTLALRSFCDDVYGNIYASGGNGTVYKSAGGTGDWTRIDAGILAITVDTPTINDIAGDSLVVAATNFGVFVTRDQGNSWFEASNGIHAEHFFGFAKNSPDRFIVSTNLGIFYNDAGDTVWHKCFPPSGYLGSLPIYKDTTQRLYTVLPNTDPTSKALGPVYKSTDNGVTWNADTMGLSATIGRVFFVDERGGEHIGSSYNGFSQYARVYSQDVSGKWILDTSGIPNTNFSYSTSFGTDRAGFIYLSGIYAGGQRVFHRAITGGNWTVDTVGLPSSVHNFAIMRQGAIGDVFGTNNTSLYRHSAGAWSEIPLPSSSISKFTVDKRGAIFVVNRTLIGFSYVDVGISMSTDNGVSWTALTIDTIDVNVIHSRGDTSYALLENGGLYTLTKNGIVTSVESQPPRRLPVAFQLLQNYPNPFNPVTIINYRLPSTSFVTLRLYNILGEEVETLVNGMEQGGYKTVRWDGSNMPSGVYFLHLQAGPFSAVNKIVWCR